MCEFTPTIFTNRADELSTVFRWLPCWVPYLQKDTVFVANDSSKET